MFNQHRKICRFSYLRISAFYQEFSNTNFREKALINKISYKNLKKILINENNEVQ